MGGQWGPGKTSREVRNRWCFTTKTEHKGKGGYRGVKMGRQVGESGWETRNKEKKKKTKGKKKTQR